MSEKFADVVVCPSCEQVMSFDGAQSDGDGDVYDLYVCPVCQHRERRNERFFDHAGGLHHNELDAWLADMPVIGETQRLFWGGFFFDVEFVMYEDGLVKAEISRVEIGCANDPELDDIPF